MCTWEYDSDLVPPPPPPDNDTSPEAQARNRLLTLRNDTSNPFPKHIIPHEFVAFLRARTHVPAAYAATAAVAIVRAGLHGQFTLERARAAMIAYVLRILHFHTPQSMMSMRGVPVAKDRCHVCGAWVESRWGISDTHGDAARALIGTFVERETETGAKRPLPFDKRRESIHNTVVRIVAARFAHLAHVEGILVCWACAIPVVLQIHARNGTQDHPTEGPPSRLVRTTSLNLVRPTHVRGLGTPRAPPPVSNSGPNVMSRSHSLPSSPPPPTDAGTDHPTRPYIRPVRACTRVVPRLDLPPQNVSECIRGCVTCIIERRPLVCGLVCHPAPYMQPSRVPYGHGDLVGSSFAYCAGGTAQIYLVAPAHQFVENAHGPLTEYDDTQLCVYYRSTPDMQRPVPVFGSTPLLLRLGLPRPPTSPQRGVPVPTVFTTPNRYIPPTSHSPHSDNASLLRMYRRIARVVASRFAVNPDRGGGNTARRILSHTYGLPRDNAVCKDVYKLIARMAHPDKNRTRDAYHCAMAEIVMDTAQRASDMITSALSLDRGAFHPLPALESAQFYAMVDVHRMAKVGHPTLGRSPATPSTVQGRAAPILTGRLLSTIPRIPSLSLLDSAEPFSPAPRTLPVTDLFPDDTQTRLRSQPSADWCFSDAEDEDNDDGLTSGLLTPPISFGDARPTPTRTVVTATGRSSAFFLHTPCDPAPAAGSHQRVHDGGRPELHLSHSPYDTAPAADSHHGARANDEFEPHLLQASGESEPHLSHTHYELAPHLLHPRHDPIPTADSHRGGRVGSTSASNLSHTHYDPAFAGAAAAAGPSSAVLLRAQYDPASDTVLHHRARVGGASESHLSATQARTTADPSATVAPVATTLVASSSPEVTEGSTGHFSTPVPPAPGDATTTDASATGTSAAPPPPPFHVPADAEDAAPAASSSPGVALGAADGVTAVAASAADTGMMLTRISIPAVVAPTPREARAFMLRR